MKRILVINPGSTSTKIAIYEDATPVFGETLRHSTEELAHYAMMYDQYAFREKVICDCLVRAGFPLETFDAIIGRGGMLMPIPSGTYRINALMIQHLIEGYSGQHASNLGGLLASRLAAKVSGCQSFIADPVTVDELQDVARVTGIPAITRLSVFHALNQKAIAKKHAVSVGGKYAEMNLIVCHLGGGISVSAHCKGSVIDTNNALHGEGPIAPERAGTIPALQLAQLCFSGQYTLPQIQRMLNGKGGVVAHLGTNSFMEVSARVESGDSQAITIYRAVAYTIAKCIGSMAVTLQGKVDGILFTGGIAHDRKFIKSIEDQVSWIAPCFVYPGEDEMGALAQNALAVLSGEEEAREYC